MYIKRLSFGVVEDALAASGPEARGRSSSLIAAAVCHEDGTPAMTFDEAYQLRSSLARLLSDAIREVNELGKRNAYAAGRGLARARLARCRRANHRRSQGAANLRRGAAVVRVHPVAWLVALGRRIECAAALVALQVNQSAGGSASYQGTSRRTNRGRK